MNIEQARANMITQQIRAWEVSDQLVLDVVASTPREHFVPAAYRKLAFADMNVPLGHDQVMLTPKEEARIIQSLKIQAGEHLLEVGTGSAYMTALLAKLGQHVVSVDIFPEFIQAAQEKLTMLDISNVTLQVGDAARGWSRQQLYNVIVITGSLPFLPEDFRHSLEVGGRLFAIIGQAPTMEAVLFKRLTLEEWSEEKLFETVVPSLLNATTSSKFVF